MSHDNKLNEMGLQIQSGMLLVKESWHPFAYDSLLKRNLLDFLFVWAFHFFFFFCLSELTPPVWKVLKKVALLHAVQGRTHSQFIQVFVKIYFLLGPLMRHVTKYVAVELLAFHAAWWHLYSKIVCSLNTLFEK